MTNKSFEKKLNSPFFKYSKRVFDIIALNFIFCVVSLLSCMVLFFPGIVSLHKIMYNFVHDNDEPVYSTFFLEIKRQWSFSWRLEVLGMVILLAVGGIIYLDYTYILNKQYDIWVWASLVLVICSFIVLLTIYFNFMLFNSYYDDDTFFMMIKKSALITRKHFLKSLLNLVIFICFIVVFYLLPYLIPFLPFTSFIYIIEAINRKQFTKISMEEKERMTLAENLFLPSVIEDKEKK